MRAHLQSIQIKIFTKGQSWPEHQEFVQINIPALETQRLQLIRQYIFYRRHLIRSMAGHAAFFSRSHSYLGRNLMFCCQRYNCTLSEILGDRSDSVVWSFSAKSTTELQKCEARLLSELIITIH